MFFSLLGSVLLFFSVLAVPVHSVQVLLVAFMPFGMVQPCSGCFAGESAWFVSGRTFEKQGK